MNGEHFAVMAGAGVHARMIKEADGGMKDRFDRQFLCELDGGARPAVSKMKVKVHPSSIRICVPAKEADGPVD